MGGSQAAEVGIGRIKNTPVFDGQGREVGIHDKIRRSLAIHKHSLQYPPMTVGRMDETHTGLVYPALDSFQGLF